MDDVLDPDLTRLLSSSSTNSSWLLKVPNDDDDDDDNDNDDDDDDDDDDNDGGVGVRGLAISSPGVSLGTDEVGGWCDDDNHDEGGDHSRLNVKSRNIEKHCLI